MVDPFGEGSTSRERGAHVSNPAGESDGAGTARTHCCLEAAHREHGVGLSSERFGLRPLPPVGVDPHTALDCDGHRRREAQHVYNYRDIGVGCLCSHGTAIKAYVKVALPEQISHVANLTSH